MARDRSSHGLVARAVAGALRSTQGKIGITLLTVVLMVVITGPFLAPYPPNKNNVGPVNGAPSSEHLLGTDSFGRDVLSRVLVGGDTVLIVPLIAVMLALVVGGALALTAAYSGGWFDSLVSRALDLLVTMPGLLIVLLFITGLGTSLTVLVGCVALIFVPWLGKLVRAAAQNVVSSDYVAAARARGETRAWIQFREIVPNVASQTISMFALYLTSGIVFVATLSFLGLGVQPPEADWGLMVAEAQSSITVSPWAAIAPAACIAALAVSFSLLSTALGSEFTDEVTPA